MGNQESLQSRTEQQIESQQRETKAWRSEVSR